MERYTAFGLYGDTNTLMRLVEDAPEWVRGSGLIHSLDGGKARFDFLCWQNQPDLASHFERYFGVGDPSHPITSWVGNEFVGAHVWYDDMYMISELLMDFIEDWKELNLPNTHQLLKRFKLDLCRAVYWWGMQDELREAGVKIVWRNLTVD